MKRLAIASSSQIAAIAGAEIAEVGGSPVDAAIAASLVQLVTESEIVSLGGGPIEMMWRPEERLVMINGTSEMPGCHVPNESVQDKQC